VAPQGNDANPGTSIQAGYPFKTIQRAIDATQPGDTIDVYPGTYVVSNTRYGWRGVSLHKSGRADARITLKAVDPAQPPTVDCSPMKPPSGSNMYCLFVSGSYWTVQNLTFANTAAGPAPSFGNGAHNSGGDFNRYENIKIVNSTGIGFLMDGDSRGNLLKNCIVHDSYNPANPGNSDGIALVNMPSTAMGNVVDGCVSSHGTDDGLDLWGTEAPVEIKNTIIAYAGIIWDTKQPIGGAGTGLKLGENTSGPSHFIHNNIVCKSNVSGINSNGARGSMRIFNNLAFDNRDIEFGFWNTTGQHNLKNNVAYSPNDPAFIYIVSSNNQLNNSWNTSGVSVSAADFVSLDCNAFLGPRSGWPNVGKLTAGSDLIDRGVNVGLPYSGPAPDLGAKE
jgi:hypothetical protein